jgi:hypothetical protein
MKPMIPPEKAPRIIAASAELLSGGSCSSGSGSTFVALEIEKPLRERPSASFS